MEARTAIAEGLAANTPITRYMSFSSFSALLMNQTLFFRAVAGFPDQFEGTGTELDKFFRSGGADALHSLVNFSLPAALGVGLTKDRREELRRQAEEYRTQPRFLDTPFGDIPLADESAYHSVISALRRGLDARCWYMSNEESMAMWNVFGGGQEAVCIHSTVAQLAEAARPPDNKRIFLAPITYIDYEKGLFETGGQFASVLHKQLPYRFENELRAIVWDPDLDLMNAQRSAEDTGSLVGVDTKRLISKVGLAPGAGAWFRQLVADTVKQHLGVEVSRSVLDRPAMR